MRQSLCRALFRAWLTRSLRSRAVRSRRCSALVLPLAAGVSLLGAAVPVLSPAASAAGSAYQVSEVPVGVPAYSVAANPATDTIYAATAGGVDVIDGASNSFTEPVSTQFVVGAVAVDSSSDTVYAFSAPDLDTADVINGAANTVTATINVLISAASAVADPDTHMVYAVGLGGPVVVINGLTDAVTWFQLPGSHPTGGMVMDSGTDTLYVTDAAGDQVDVIDGATDAVTGRIALPAGSDPAGLAIDPAAGLVYVADQGTGAISVIDTATNNTVSTLASGMTQPTGLAFDPGSGTLYAVSRAGSADGLGTTYVIDASNGLIADQLQRGGAYVTVTGGSAYVSWSPGALASDVSVVTPSTTVGMSPVIVNDLPVYPTFTVGQAVQDQMSANAMPAATFSATGLPAGLTLSSSGLLSGTPAAGTGGEYFPVVTAANGIAPPATSDILIMTIDQAPAITSADETSFAIGAANSFTVTASGFPPPTFSETGALPAGVSFAADAPEGPGLSGTPAAGTAGSYPIEITATNSAGSTTQAFTLIVARYQNPAMVWTGNAVLITAADGTGGLAYWWQAADTATWHQQQVASGTVSYQNPAITWTGNAALITATDNAGNLDFWWQAAGTSTWHQQQVAAAAGGVSYQNPTMVWTGSATLVTATDNAGNVDFWWQAAGTPTWHQQQVAAGGHGVSYQNPAITWTGSATLVTATDNAGNLDFWWQAAGTPTWNRQQVAPTASDTFTYQHPAIAWTGNVVLVTAEDDLGDVDFWWQAAGTGIWHQQQIAAVSHTVTYQNPAITWTGDAVLVTATDLNGNVYFWWQAAGTTVWNQQQVAAASSAVSYQNPVITWAGDAALVSAADSSGNVDFWWQAAGTGAWHHEQVAAG